MANSARSGRHSYVDRRSFLRTAAAGATAAAVAIGGRRAWAQTGGTLTVTSYGGPWESERPAISRLEGVPDRRRRASEYR